MQQRSRQVCSEVEFVCLVRVLRGFVRNTSNGVALEAGSAVLKAG
jgi:hypothetical protein